MTASARAEGAEAPFNASCQGKCVMERDRQAQSTPEPAAQQQLEPSLEQLVQQRTQELRLNEARLRSLVSLSSDWIWEHDEEGRLTYLSEGASLASGRSLADLLGRRAQEFEGFDCEERMRVRHAQALARHESFRDVVYGARAADGSMRYFSISGEPVSDAQGRFVGYRGVGTDVTLATQASRELSMMARFDALTGLPNRAQFVEELDRVVARSRRSDGQFGLCFIDLDGFKQINDTLGHGIGDTLLRAVAGRLQEQVRSGDIVARMGGDEFTILLGRLSSAEEGVAIARRLLAALSRPVRCGGRDLFVTASIGGSFHPGDGDTAEILLRHADLAMYQAKRRGNRICLFEPALDHAARERLRIENLLRRGLERREFDLHYQPTLRIATGEIESFEALLRWRNPSSEAPVTPDRLVAQAERAGLMDALGQWIVDSAAAHSRTRCGFR